MIELTTAQITEYLKQASSLESSVYKQERTRQEARNGLRLRTINVKEIEKPCNKADKMPKPEMPRTAGRLESFIALGWFFLVLPIVICFFMGSGDALMFIVPFMGIFAVPCLIVGYISRKRQGEANEKEYSRLWQQYKEDKKKYEEEYESAIKSYNERMTAEKEKVKQANEVARRNFDKAKEGVDLLDAPLSETKELLAKLYTADIIFPKYRNMVAMCTMYEYFASGRCTELTGANGAYNLYEAELRQNLIINQLEAVNMNLEQVKQNQYILYQGIMETNQTLHEISSDVKSVVNATYDIAVSSRIAAYCSQITAANAQAQTYLAIMD